MRSSLASLFALGLIGLCPAHAADKPPLAPDTVVPFSTNSRLSAGIEFSLPALAADIERDIPQRLASIDEKIECVHRRILFFKVNANCDVWGYVERSGGVSLYGRGDRVYGSVPIHGVLEGQGANRFTARIHGETEASATIEATARPQLGRDWSLDLHFGDGFRWSEPPVLQVMGREIPLAKYAEPRIRTQLAVVREHALAAARRLDLHDKAATAWRHAFEPIQLSDSPAVWLQMTPQSVSFAGMRANPRTLRGSIELSGTAQTIDRPESACRGRDGLADAWRGREYAPAHSMSSCRCGSATTCSRKSCRRRSPRCRRWRELPIKDVDVYPSAGKLVVGLRVAKAADTDPGAGKWVYLSGTVQADAGGRAIRLCQRRRHDER